MSKTKDTPALPVAPAPAADEDHAGKGGAYEIKDGKRVLVERTKPRPESDAGETL